MKHQFHGEIYEKVLKYQISWNRSSGSLVVPCGRADGHGDANSRYLQFRERAKVTRCLSLVGIILAARVYERAYVYALSMF